MQLTGNEYQSVCLTDFKVPELTFKLPIHAASVP